MFNINNKDRKLQNAKNVTIGALNVNSIRKIGTVEELANNIDICLLSEPKIE